MAARTNQATFLNQLRTLAAGIPTVPIADPWELDGKSYTKAQLAQLILGFISSTDAANAAKVAAKQAVATADSQRTQASAMRSLIHMLLEAQLGKTSPVLGQLGFVKAASTPTLAEKSAAADKSKATREARHTMGPKQKAKVTGETVTGATATAPGVTVTPTTTGTAAK